MLGLEHKTSRGSIIIEYYGRDVGIKIMPTGEGVAAVGVLLWCLSGSVIQFYGRDAGIKSCPRMSKCLHLVCLCAAACILLPCLLVDPLISPSASGLIMVHPLPACPSAQA